MHRRAEGEDDVRDVLVDAGLLSDLHVRGDRRNGGAGAERHRRRAEEFGEHDLRRALASAEAGVDREEDEHVREAHQIVDDESAAVVADQLGTVRRDEVGEEAEETDGRIVGDELDGLHDAIRQILEDLGGLCLRAAGHLDAEAEQHGRHNQGQNRAAAQQFRKVGLGEEVDDHILPAERVADLTLADGVLAADEREDAADDVHQYARDGGGDKERRDRGTHDLTGALHVLHVGDSGANGAEHHRHHDAEHHIDKEGSEELNFQAESGPDTAHDAAKHDTRQHADDKPVVFQKFHVISSLPMHLSGAGTMIARRAGVYVSYYMA